MFVFEFYFILVSYYMRRILKHEITKIVKCFFVDAPKLESLPKCGKAF